MGHQLMIWLTETNYLLLVQLVRSWRYKAMLLFIHIFLHLPKSSFLKTKDQYSLIHTGIGTCVWDWQPRSLNGGIPIRTIKSGTPNRTIDQCNLSSAISVQLGAGEP